MHLIITIPLYLATVLISLVLVNIFQYSSLIIYPFSKRNFFLYNGQVARMWFLCFTRATNLLVGTKLVMSGDSNLEDQHVMIMANHRSALDIVAMMMMGTEMKKGHYLRWMAKDIVKYIPLLGQGMYFIGCIFLKRNWKKDKNLLQSSFSRFLKYDLPFWCILHPEGTRMTPQKLKTGQAWQRRNAYTVTHHVLPPRTKGIVSVISAIPDKLQAVYDMTIYYDQLKAPSLLDFLLGRVDKIYIHVKRIPLMSLPSKEDELSNWIHNRFKIKDDFLDHFYT